MEAEKGLKKELSPRTKKILYWVGGIFAFFVIVSAIGGASTEKQAAQVPAAPSQPQTQAAPVASNQPSKDDAQKQLDSVMSLSKQAGLVTSYEFSNSASVVYAGATWYTQTVQFKKDFVAKIATLKKAITGYAHFEVDDAYSNEKVGEVTPLGSLEVYK